MESAPTDLKINLSLQITICFIFQNYFFYLEHNNIIRFILVELRANKDLFCFLVFICSNKDVIQSFGLYYFGVVDYNICM